jgi:hypothetical protein
MYTACVFCQSPLGSNDHIEHVDRSSRRQTSVKLRYSRNGREQDGESWR